MAYQCKFRHTTPPQWPTINAHGRLSEAIYFDGHLPVEKLPVRKDRLLRRTSELGSLQRNSPAGCPGSFLASHGADYNRCHAALARRRHVLPQNPFTVQVIIDTLRLSSRYAAVTHVVPGEADPFCAEMARTAQATFILTSDSDLLIYDIGSSNVVFLDDVLLPGHDVAPSCSVFSLPSLEARLELTGTDSAHGVRRFAFELVKTPHASLLQLLAACKEPADGGGYAEFSRGYEAQQIIVSLPSAGVDRTPLDSRLLELVIQTSSHVLPPPYQTRSQSSGPKRIFLPNPLENYARSSCFDASTDVRRIAYSLLPWKAENDAQGIWEFKRLNILSGRGTPVRLCSPSELPTATRELTEVLSHVVSQVHEEGEYLWPAIAMGLDTRYARSEGKTAVVSNIAGMALRVSEMSLAVPWDVVHFRAQVHACCYSFRLLGQVLSLVRLYDPSETSNTVYDLMRPYLSRVPSLGKLPSTDTILEFLSPAPRNSVMAKILRDLVQPGLALTESHVSATPKKVRKRKQNDTRAAHIPDPRNRFGVLLDVGE